MNERPFSPGEFVRLLSLPEEHPDRRQAESAGMLNAWREMLREFEEPPASIASPSDLASADAALDHRMAAVIDPRPAVRGGPASGGSSEPGFLARLAAFLFGPALRPALAMATVALVAGVAWWVGNTHLPRAVRGPGGEAGFVVAARSGPGPAGGLELSWAAVPGAERYRVRFFGSALEEIARLDSIPEPRLRLERSSLPAGLTPGSEVLLEVAAIRGGDVIAVSASRALRLP